MRAGLVLLLCLAPAAAVAKPEGRTDCGLYAVLRGEDQGDISIYDGVRKGLELARLPRICREDVDPWPGGLKKLVDEIMVGGDPGPLYAIGDEAVEALAAIETTLPRVYVVQRYSVGRRTLRRLPQWASGATVYTDIGAERIVRVLRGLFGNETVRADFAWGRIDAPSREADLRRFRRAAGITEPQPVEKRPAKVLLHLRLGIGYPLLPYAKAVEQARRMRVPLLSDDRGRFGQGAIVTLVARHDLVGRTAADAGRRLRAKPELVLPPRAVTGFEVWVDLEAADAQGIELPLAFLARADKLKRSKARRPR